MKTKHVVALAAFALGAFALFAGEDLARHVDPFIGTKGTTHCYPNATTPFGLVQPGPASGTGEWAYTGGYQFEDPKLYGFNQTAISGTGCSDLGDLLVQPFTGPAVRADHYQFAKSAEKASPGYYAVTYPETGVMTEIAAAPHVAFYRFTFAKGGPAHVLLDLQWGIVGRGRLATHVLVSKIDFPDDRTVTGHNETSHWVRRDWYYAIAFDHAVKARTKLAPRDPREKGTRWVLDFDVQPGETILMKVALSSQSVAGAQANLVAEVPGWDFDAVHARARTQWNDLFARAQASGTDEQKKTFYTSFYHLCISPNNISDVGAPRDFGTLSLWDTFRAAHPLYTILCPELVPDFITSMMTDYKKNGFLSIWTLWDKDNQCMIGTHSVPVLVDAYLKGFPADWEAVYAAIRDTLRNPHPNRRKENWDLLDQYGYYPFDKIKGESVSRTLECAYDDWCAAQMAAKLGKTEDAAFFAKRAQNWKNVFDASIGFVRGRDTHGKWRDPFDPFRLGHGAGTANDFTEGNAFQYSWHVMQDPDEARLPLHCARQGGGRGTRPRRDWPHRTVRAWQRAEPPRDLLLPARRRARQGGRPHPRGVRQVLPQRARRSRGQRRLRADERLVHVQRDGLLSLQPLRRRIRDRRPAAPPNYAQNLHHPRQQPLHREQAREIRHAQRQAPRTPRHPPRGYPRRRHARIRDGGVTS